MNPSSVTHSGHRHRLWIIAIIGAAVNTTALLLFVIVPPYPPSGGYCEPAYLYRYPPVHTNIVIASASVYTDILNRIK